MDAVYILGSESPANNEEIRHSVRSLDRHMADLRDIYIIGEDPGFLPGAKHIYHPDASPDKWRNGYEKVKRACEEPGISDTFLLMNDDFILQDDFIGDEFPYYALEKADGGTCGPRWFGVHCPIQINKAAYLKMPFDPAGGVCKSPRTFYANIYGFPVKLTKDHTVNLYSQLGTFDEQTKGKPWFSFSNNTAADPGFMRWLDELYPEPSRFEAQGALGLDSKQV